MASIAKLAGIMLGLVVTFAGLGATVAFGYFAFLGVPLLVVGLGILSAAIDS
jgi:hypothetical protein